jgi:hypothetical protein
MLVGECLAAVVLVARTADPPSSVVSAKGTHRQHSLELAVHPSIDVADQDSTGFSVLGREVSLPDRATDGPGGGGDTQGSGI